MLVSRCLQQEVIDALRAHGDWMDGRELAAKLGRSRTALQSILNNMRTEPMIDGWAIHCRRITRYSEYRITHSQMWYAEKMLRHPPPMRLVLEEY